MVLWPTLGTRVTIRYRRPAGSFPPLTDTVGHLLAVHPTVRVRTKSGAIVEFAAPDAVALRVLTDTPVRTSQIRNLEYAATAGWPGLEQIMLDGWLLRAGRGVTFAANSAMPLGISAQTDTIPDIVSWYAERDLTPRLAIPDRLLPLPADVISEHVGQMLVRDVQDVPTAAPHSSITLSDRPDNEWLRYSRMPPDLLTAVRDGELAFGTYPGVAVARAAVTDAPDGTYWVGLSAICALDDQPEPATWVCEALLAWGADRGATRAYLQVDEHKTNAVVLAETLGFRLHHRTRFLPVSPSSWVPFRHA